MGKKGNTDKAKAPIDQYRKRLGAFCMDTDVTCVRLVSWERVTKLMTARKRTPSYQDSFQSHNDLSKKSGLQTRKLISNVTYAQWMCWSDSKPLFPHLFSRARVPKAQIHIVLLMWQSIDWCCRAEIATIWQANSQEAIHTHDHDMTYKLEHVVKKLHYFACVPHLGDNGQRRFGARSGCC